MAAPGAPAELERRPDPRLRALLSCSARPRSCSPRPDRPGAGQPTGWQRPLVIGRPFVELMALAREQPAMLQDLERARSGDRVTGSEAWLRLPDGQEPRLV